MTLKIQNLCKSYENMKVFQNFHMEISENHITCILGPSGCGKTTLLNMISGIIQQDDGTFLGLEHKVISYLFQEPRLLDWKTVWGNIEFILKDIYQKEEREKIISKYIEMVGLKEFKDYYPPQLSGGMMQRVSIARAFAYPSDILLMDEPFKGLDIKIKESLFYAFIKLWNEDLRTVIFVTHDIEEALLLGDHVYVLGDIPVKIKKCFEISMPREKRSMEKETLKEIKKEIYKILK
ncbi:ABC transporter ATP-binding protein [Marinisporobacter balticus]|uniref:NitT/TauT family transport system ATP-binding protein n=1 Tax=Marinisporobacter balticus TaxID=2018667 RepID=A0A4R2L0F5_9FIRM|nr:ABC transporter ATP-binding protein [Marinisporobacter balticus]TCO78657.1 NitT/TauT family transport system ATP-binding protein [Marinisporobacter balticus]